MIRNDGMLRTSEVQARAMHEEHEAMSDTTIIRAVEDESVNFVRRLSGNAAFEARYVRRTSDYIIAYVSSQGGCDRACRFCHLTATGQTDMTQADADDFVAQISSVLSHHDAQAVRPARMNVNWMARGEPLLNPIMRDRSSWSDLRHRILSLAAAHAISDVRFNVSTIMPTASAAAPIEQVFADGDVTLYYSLYSMRPAFRRRWLPKAVEPNMALRMLAEWQRRTGQLVALHWAFIEGENDDLDTISEIVDAVRRSGLRPKFNAVRYNPFDPRRGRESAPDIVERNFRILSEAFPHPESRIVPRVGFSAKASCGMFVESGEVETEQGIPA